MSDIDLHEVLARASDSQNAPELAHRAVVTANRRLARRRGGVAGALVAVVVAGIVLVPRVTGPAQEPVQEPTTSPEPSVIEIPDTDPTQPVWDPNTLGSAPLHSTNMPERIDVRTARGPTLSERTMSGIVAALQDDTSLRLLDKDGTWRTLPSESAQGFPFSAGDVARPAIASDGTRVAVAAEAGIRIIDATTGAELTLPWPQQFAPPWDNPPDVKWQPGDDGLIVSGNVRASLVELDGTSRDAPYRSYALGIDPDGPVYQNDFQARRLLTWSDDDLVDESPFIQCNRIVAGYGHVACTTGSLQSGRSGPVVVDPATGDVVAYAPIKDPNATYSDNAGLTLLGFLDEETVLMLVGPGAYSAHDVPGERHLVTWRFGTGELRRISTGDATDIRALAVAPKLVD